MQENKAVIKKNVSMYAGDWDVVQDVSERMRLRNTSAALRYIVNEYRQMAHQLPLPLAAANPTQERES